MVSVVKSVLDEANLDKGDVAMLVGVVDVFFHFTPAQYNEAVLALALAYAAVHKVAVALKVVKS